MADLAISDLDTAAAIPATGDRFLVLDDSEGEVASASADAIVNAGMFAANAIDSAEIADNAVDDEAAIDALALTTAKFAADAVATSTQIADGAVTVGKIAALSVDTAFILNGAVTAALVSSAGMVADGTYLNVTSMTIDQQGRVTAITGAGPI